MTSRTLGTQRSSGCICHELASRVSANRYTTIKMMSGISSRRRAARAENLAVRDSNFGVPDVVAAIALHVSTQMRSTG
jgi:hypothetical protein